jgi:hypothetical protein
MLRGLTLFAVTEATTVAARAGAPTHQAQTSAARTYAKIAVRNRKLSLLLVRYDVLLEPKWLIFGQP